MQMYFLQTRLRGAPVKPLCLRRTLYGIKLALTNQGFSFRDWSMNNIIYIVGVVVIVIAILSFLGLG